MLQAAFPITVAATVVVGALVFLGMSAHSTALTHFGLLLQKELASCIMQIQRDISLMKPVLRSICVVCTVEEAPLHPRCGCPHKRASKPVNLQTPTVE